jgi:hypothetical protein
MPFALYSLGMASQIVLCERWPHGHNTPIPWHQCTLAFSENEANMLKILIIGLAFAIGLITIAVFWLALKYALNE